MINITRYSIKNPALLPWVKFIWHLESVAEVSINHKLLPSDSIDIILNMSDQVEYKIGNQIFTPDDFHFNGIRDQYGYVLQQGPLNVFGISFFPYGLFPVLRQPLSDYTNQIVSLRSVSEVLQERFELALLPEASVNETVRSLEKALALIYMPNHTDQTAAALLQDYCRRCQAVSIRGFCLNYKINIKTFERLCLKYTGYPPKTLQRISRFQNASNQLIYSTPPENLAGLAYENDYYDQAHLTKEFRNYSGSSPGQFIKENDTLKGNTKYTYK
jgi:AraC-like DNA-binding protein